MSTSESQAVKLSPMELILIEIC